MIKPAISPSNRYVDVGGVPTPVEHLETMPEAREEPKDQPKEAKK